MIFCKQNQLSDIFLTKTHHGIYTLTVRSTSPKNMAFDDKQVLIDKICQLQVEGKRVPDYVFGLLEEE